MKTTGELFYSTMCHHQQTQQRDTYFFGADTFGKWELGWANEN